MDTSLETNNLLLKTFELIKKERNEVAAIHQEFKSFPQGVAAHYQFYKEIIMGPNLPLERGVCELLAVLTSQRNSCSYCIEHHSEALRKFDCNITTEVYQFFKKLCKALTNEPWKATHLKSEALNIGLTEAEYSHAVMVISYFNMANRLVYGMDIQLEEDFKNSCH